MDTLYDLLGALPRDDAEGLRAAFRRAVKGVHPDLNPDDPDAGQKFRQIVRAQEILLDGEQRAAYDHLLELARIEVVEHARAGRIHRLSSWVMALAGASAVSIGGLALVALLWTSTEPAADTDPSADSAAAAKITAALEPAPAPAETAEAKETTETANDVLPPLGPPIDIVPPGAMESSVAPADISHSKRVEKAARSANTKKKGPGAAESGTKPAPARRTAQIEVSRQDGFTSNPRP